MLTNARLKILGTLIASVLLGGAAYLYHRQQHPDWLALDGVTTGMSFAMAALSAGTVWLFLDSVSHFKSELQKSYRLLCVGIILFGLAQLQYGLFVVVLGWQFWLDSGIITLPYLLFAIFMFMAMRKFAAILDIRGRITSYVWVIATALVAAVVFVLLPHTSQPSALSYAVTTGLAIWDAIFVAFTASLTGRIKNALGETYARPMSRLYLGLNIVVLAGLHFAVIEMLYSAGDWYYDASLTLVPFFAGSLVFLWAGYDMVIATGGVARSYSIGRAPAPATTDAPLIDIIVYTASLASIQSEIDGLLDPLRRVTSTLSADRTLTPHDHTTLKHVYANLEAYLTMNERLRSFTTEELRALITRKFNLSNATAEDIWRV